MATFAIRTKNARDNKHLNAIGQILEAHGCSATFGYVMRGGEMIGGKWTVDDVSEGARAAIDALAIPASVRIHGA